MASRIIVADESVA